MTERARHPDAFPADLAGESEALSELLLELASAPERDPARLDVRSPPSDEGGAIADRSLERVHQGERGAR